MPIYTALGRTMILTLCLHPKSSVRLKPYLLHLYLLFYLLVWLLTLPLPFATFSARTIDCVVRQVKVGDHWGIVDQCWGLQDAIMEGMVDPDYESEDDPDS